MEGTLHFLWGLNRWLNMQQFPDIFMLQFSAVHPFAKFCFVDCVSGSCSLLSFQSFLSRYLITRSMSCRRTRSQSCPFCRDSLKRVNSADLWVLMDSKDVVDMDTLTRENLRRLFMYIDKLPLVVPDNLFDPYDKHLR